MIQMKVDTSALRAAIAEEIKQADAKGERASKQILIEGVNVAQQLCLKDTNALNDSIQEASSVTRIAPCQFAVTLANGVDYGAAQETGPIESKKVWRFRSHIRPAAMIMQVKAPEIIDDVFSE
jgi:hypothetical protein